MALKQILLIGNPLLRQKSCLADFRNDPIQQYINDLRDTLRHFQKENGLGRAMAGPQIAYHKRIEKI